MSSNNPSTATMPSSAVDQKENQNPNPNLNSMEYHRKVLESRLRDGANQQPAYISPSDNIQSPATQKLAAFKTKHMGKGLKPQSLFAKTVKKNADEVSPTSKPMFGDIPQQ